MTELRENITDPFQRFVVQELQKITERLDRIETDVSEIKEKINAIDVFYIGGIRHLGQREGPFKAHG